MEKNLYVMEFIYIIFYFLLGVFIYYNAQAIINFSKSNEIVVENTSPQCEIPPISLTKIDLTTLKKCTASNQYFYSIQDLNLNFVISENKSDTGYFVSLCKNYCDQKYYDVIKNKCNSPNDTIYQNCLKLLEPSSGCANSSNPIGTDEKTFNNLYPVKVPEGNSC
tara:strand:- start:701 stop:1195 length:495 start_codon:yes stop_codon:yes gene_type:complete